MPSPDERVKPDRPGADTANARLALGRESRGQQVAQRTVGDPDPTSTSRELVCRLVVTPRARSHSQRSQRTLITTRSSSSRREVAGLTPPNPRPYGNIGFAGENGHAHLSALPEIAPITERLGPETTISQGKSTDKIERLRERRGSNPRLSPHPSRYDYRAPGWLHSDAGKPVRGLHSRASAIISSPAMLSSRCSATPWPPSSTAQRKPVRHQPTGCSIALWRSMTSPERAATRGSPTTDTPDWAWPIHAAARRPERVGDYPRCAVITT